MLSSPPPPYIEYPAHANLSCKVAEDAMHSKGTAYREHLAGV